MPISPGDDLGPLMADTRWQATQSGVDAEKVNFYAEQMIQNNWNWLPLNRRNPILVDQADKIMSGHHRFVAARLAGVFVPEAAIQRFSGSTSRPVTEWSKVLVR